MSTVYWKGGNAGTGSQQNDPDNRLNWVTASGGSTAIDATTDFAGLANGTTDVVIDYATSGTTHCLVVSGTNKKVWKSLTINYHASLSKILYINATTLTLSGLDVNKGKTIFSSGTGIIKFTGVPKFTTSNSSSPNMYVKINSSQDISFNTDIESGMFFDNLTRLNITFLFEPPNNTILVLSNGIYPHMDFDCASTDLALLSTEELPIADKYNSYFCRMV